jgi:hypothetical protein
MKAKIVHALLRTHCFRATFALTAVRISLPASLGCLDFQHFGGSGDL